MCLSSPCLFSVLPTSVIARLKIRPKNRGECVFLLYVIFFFFLIKIIPDSLHLESKQVLFSHNIKLIMIIKI